MNKTFEYIKNMASKRKKFSFHLMQDAEYESKILYLKGIALTLSYENSPLVAEANHLRLLINTFSLPYDEILEELSAFLSEPSEDDLKDIFTAFNSEVERVCFFLDCLALANKNGQVGNQQEKLIEEIAKNIDLDDYVKAASMFESLINKEAFALTCPGLSSSYKTFIHLTETFGDFPTPEWFRYQQIKNIFLTKEPVRNSFLNFHKLAFFDDDLLDDEIGIESQIKIDQWFKTLAPQQQSHLTNLDIEDYSTVFPEDENHTLNSELNNILKHLSNFK